MRTWIVAAGLCIFLFLLPLQGFIIGDNIGFGIQGAVLKWQTTAHGESLIPIPWEVLYVTGGTYTGKSALMVIFWVLGTVVLTLTTVLSLIFWDQLPRRYLRFIMMGLSGAGVLYLASCIAQYGPLLHGPAGVSVPLGVPVLFMFAGFLFVYQDFLYQEDDNLRKEIP